MRRLAGVAPSQSLKSSSIDRRSCYQTEDDSEYPRYRAGESKDTQGDAGRQRLPKFPASREFRFGNVLFPQDLPRGLRVGTNDDRISNRLQAPAGRNSLDLLRR